MTLQQQDAVPPGHRRDAKGRLVPEKLIKPIDRMRDDTVLQLITQAKHLHSVLARFKGNAFGELGAFLELSAMEYGAALGGEKGNVTLTSFDGRYQVRRQVQDSISFDERLQIAKALIDKCVLRWADGANDNIRVLVLDAFQVDKENRVNIARIMGLKRLKIDDAEWASAMQAIHDSVQTLYSTMYLRFYERVGDTEKYQAISLDIASL
jgi:hypothetical protein